LNNLPVDVVREMGADIVIASSVGNPHKERREIRNPIDVLSQSFNILRDKTLNANIDDADIVIDTKLYGLGPADFVNKKVVRIIDAGEKAAKETEPQLIALKEKYQLHSNRFNRQDRVPDSSVRVGEIIFSGNHTIPETAIREVFKIREGDLFAADSMNFYLEQLKATGDFYWVRYTTKSMGKGRIRLKVFLGEKKRPIIYGVNIFGNETLSFDFIYRLLGIRPGEIFIHSRIEDRISYLYSLGYFEKIYYDIDPVGDNSVRFNLYVKESPELRVRLGLRYDNYYQLIAALNLLIINKPVPGLRIENEFQFIGKEMFSSQAYYPSRTLNFPLYPFAKFDYESMKIFLYDQDGNKSASYRNRYIQAGVGLGLLYKNYWNMEAAWDYEWANIHPIVAVNDPTRFPSWKDELWKMKLSTNIDQLDDTFVPRNGLEAHANYEKSLQDMYNNNSYIRMDISLDFYKTVARKHTFHAYGFYGFVDMDSLMNKFILKGGPESCIGVEYNQLLGTTLSIARLDYRYELRKDLFVTLIGNVIIDYENDVLEPGVKPAPMTGFGVGLKYMTALGPFELILSRGEKSVYRPGAKQTVLYFNAGYKF